MTLRAVVLLTVTGLLLFCVALMVKRQAKQHSQIDDWSSPEYLAKIDRLRPIQRVRGTRPFTSEEMSLLRQFIRDPDWSIRVRAVTALFWAPKDPQQREEAIRLLIERLKDPSWVVRSYALHALARLGAKEAVPEILPLLNDSHPDVRNWAKIALKRLGYQFGQEDK